MLMLMSTSDICMWAQHLVEGARLFAHQTTHIERYLAGGGRMRARQGSKQVLCCGRVCRLSYSPVTQFSNVNSENRLARIVSANIYDSNHRRSANLVQCHDAVTLQERRSPSVSHPSSQVRRPSVATEACEIAFVRVKQALVSNVGNQKRRMPRVSTTAQTTVLCTEETAGY